MIGAWVLPLAEDSFQILRRAVTDPASMKHFFAKEHMGMAGLAGGAFKKFKGFGKTAWAENTVGNLYGYTYQGVWPLMAMGAAYYGSKAGQGQMLGTSAGFMGAALPSGVGALLAGGPGAAIAGVMYGEDSARWIRNQVNMQGSRQRKQMRFEMGDPKWEETETSYTMRQRAVKEMSGSLLNARHIMGREAALFHS